MRKYTSLRAAKTLRVWNCNYSIISTSLQSFYWESRWNWMIFRTFLNSNQNSSRKISLLSLYSTKPSITVLNISTNLSETSWFHPRKYAFSIPRLQSLKNGSNSPTFSNRKIKSSILYHLTSISKLSTLICWNHKPKFIPWMIWASHRKLIIRNRLIGYYSLFN